MIPELGHFSLILALLMAGAQAFFGFFGPMRRATNWTRVARPAAHGQLLFLSLAFAALAYAFLTNDFSVAYVAENSNTALPWFYRFGAVWGAHEGSLLLWVLILGIWTVAVARFSRDLPESFAARVLAVMGLVSMAFLLFMLLTSNPFTRLFPAPAQGRDLNPLLQDFGLVAHPPMLYMGYVGFSVVFSFAIAALMEGRLDAAWARWSRPWTVGAWLFLTVGIAMGSWWAYYELGWGGWWFWDPVENASFMPWLAGTALIHSLAVTDKRGAFKSWTVLLAIFAFSLSLLGTFLVRSGVLSSVHAFATDPRRGVFVLGILVFVVGSSLMLYAWRGPRIRAHGSFEVLSRETGLLLNNVLLTVAAAAVLLGTVYPLILDGLGLGKISVGAPYFAGVFVPLMIPLLVLLGPGSLIRWKRHGAGALLAELKMPAVVAAVAALGVWALARGLSASALAGVALGLWVLTSTAEALRARVKHSSNLWAALTRAPRGFYGMVLAHGGLAVFVLGVTVVSALGVKQDVRLAPGQSAEIAGYAFRFDGTRNAAGPNYSAKQAQVRVTRDGESVATLQPQKRNYDAQASATTEAAIDPGVWRDLFVAMGEPVGDGAWTFRIQYKPMVRWIWAGALLMALGGLLAGTDPRYRRFRQRARGRVPATAEVSTGGAA